MPTERIRRYLQFVIAAGLVVVGGVACAFLIKTKPIPARHDAFARVLEVDVSRVTPRFEQFPIVGFGTVRPRNQVEIVPLVSGKLVHSHPDLAQGNIIPKGELLFEIDPTVYDARVRQVEAEIRQLEAALGRYDQELTNLDERIANGRKVLDIDEKDYQTSKQLYEVEQVGTQRELDLIYVKFLRQKDALAELTNRRSMVPHQKLDIQAQLDGARARLSHARYNLEGTKIVSPFDARIEAVHARTSQVVTAHLSIATLTDMSAFELSVGLDPRELRWLDEAIRPGALEKRDVASGPPVKVHWSLHGQEFTWEGHVTRFERVDERTRTAQMVVEVRNIDMIARVDYGDEEGPALSIGMFCRAELPAQPLEAALLVPRHALYESRWVYVFEPDAGDPTAGRLGRRQVSMLRTVGDAVLVDYRGRRGAEVCELKPDEQLIVSRLIKPVLGMRIKLRDRQLAVASVASPATPVGGGCRDYPSAVVVAHRGVPARIHPMRGGA